MSTAPIPKRGEIWQVDFDPSVGAEIHKVRPAVVMTVTGIGRLPLQIVVPLTDWKPHYAKASWFVHLPVSSANGLGKDSGADAFQVKSVSNSRFVGVWAWLRIPRWMPLHQLLLCVSEHLNSLRGSKRGTAGRLGPLETHSQSRFIILPCPGTVRKGNYILMATSMPPNSATSQAQIERAAQGDQQAWAALLARHKDRLRRMIALRLDQRLQGRIDPEDVLQETYLEAATHLRDYLKQPAMPFFFWLRGIAGNMLLALQHRVRRWQRESRARLQLPVQYWLDPFRRQYVRHRADLQRRYGRCGHRGSRPRPCFQPVIHLQLQPRLDPSGVRCRRRCANL